MASSICFSVNPVERLEVTIKGESPHDSAVTVLVFSSKLWHEALGIPHSRGKEGVIRGQTTIQDDHAGGISTRRRNLWQGLKVQAQQAEVELIPRREIHLADIPVIQHLIQAVRGQPKSAEDDGLLIEHVEGREISRVAPRSERLDHSPAVRNALERPKLYIHDEGLG
jgi:hypothetical protein